jgi:hypothetical protein
MRIRRQQASLSLIGPPPGGDWMNDMTARPQRQFLDQPASYQIQVQGLLSRNWLADYFDEMQVAVEGEDGWAVTTLTGYMIDQAALYGLLQKLYTLGLVLLRVERQTS